MRLRFRTPASVLLRFRTPASVLLRRAQLTLILAALVPTLLATALGIVLLVRGATSAIGGTFMLVGLALVLAFLSSSLTGYILVSIFVSRGASLARVQTDFLSAVSHELRTPITSVRMFIETLESGRVSDEAKRRECLAIVAREMARLDELVAKLLALSKMEAGRLPFEERPVALADVAQAAADAFGAATLAQGVRLDVEVEPGLEVVGDRASLIQAVTNLLTNAWKYAGTPDRQIVLRAEAAGKKHASLLVRDDGPGIPATEQARIFEAFERGDAGIVQSPAGSGLGLAIVRAIARAHGGRVELASAAGRGSEFRIILPRRRRLGSQSELTGKGSP